MSKKFTKIAIAYDFDGTLAPGNMQEHSFIPELGMNSKQFWEEVKKIARENDMDEILAYMELTIRKAKEKPISIRREKFINYGKEITLFEGVSDYFKMINEYAKTKQIKIEHYIISSGLREFIQGTQIAKYFTKIFASGFMYDVDGIAKWPALAVNYTNKTQFLFRINKGIGNSFDNSTINKFVPREERIIPFSNMIYIGDGETDVPAMKTIKLQGGTAIAVYDIKKRKTQNKQSGKDTCLDLIKQKRADYIAPAVYTENSELVILIKSLIDKLSIQSDLSLIKSKTSNLIKNKLNNKNDKFQNEVKNNIFPFAYTAIENPYNIKWHQYANLPNSSQVLAIDVFGTIKISKYRDEIVNEICRNANINTGSAWNIQFEYEPQKNILNEPKSSQIDVRIYSESTELILECKFTEEEGGVCSQTKKLSKGANNGIVQCNGSYINQCNPINNKYNRCSLTGKGIKYWDFIPNIYGIDITQDYQPCPFNNGNYQWMRNLSIVDYNRSIGKNSKFIIVYVESDKLPISESIKSGSIFGNYKPKPNYYSFLSYQEIIDIGLLVSKNDIDENQIWKDLLIHFDNKTKIYI